MDETEVLFTELLNCDRVALYLNKDKTLSNDKACFIAEALRRRINSEPLDYILGFSEFMGLKFKVNKYVLIPRQETEILAETALRYASDNKSHKILEIGTGSGCIAVSLAKFVSSLAITATDISLMALDTARANAQLNGTGRNIKFVESDLFNSQELYNVKYDMIISNPPYIRSLDIADLQSEVQFEPRIALDGGIDGLDFYRRIIRQSPCHLTEGGLLILEIGFGQYSDIKNIFQKSGNFEIIEVVKDYNNIYRVVIARVRKNG